jgi:hypothetical protein
MDEAKNESLRLYGEQIGMSTFAAAELAQLSTEVDQQKMGLCWAARSIETFRATRAIAFAVGAGDRSVLVGL